MKVLKFGAVWCPGCLVMRPRWERLEAEFPWLDTEYYDYDSSPEAVQRYAVVGTLPVFIFLDASGNELTRLQGEISEARLRELVQKYRNA